MDIFKDKNILITGDTGFFGITLTKKIFKQSPQGTRLFSGDEVKYDKVQELFNYYSKIKNFIDNVRNYSRRVKAMR